jgi:hypothetical protein
MFLLPGKIMLIAIINNIIPPAIPKEDSAICNSWRIYLPINIKNNKTIKAISSSRIKTFLRLSIGMFFRMLKKTGTLPIGSIIITSNKIAAKTVT